MAFRVFGARKGCRGLRFQGLVTLKWFRGGSQDMKVYGCGVVGA